MKKMRQILREIQQRRKYKCLRIIDGLTGVSIVLLGGIVAVNDCDVSIAQLLNIPQIIAWLFIVFVLLGLLYGEALTTFLIERRIMKRNKHT